MKSQVQPGDTFISRDKREMGRRLIVDRLDGEMAVCNVHRLGGRTTKIKIRRLLSSAFLKVTKEQG